jgi:hypothetical protein
MSHYVMSEIHSKKILLQSSSTYVEVSVTAMLVRANWALVLGMCSLYSSGKRFFSRK